MKRIFLFYLMFFVVCSPIVNAEEDMIIKNWSRYQQLEELDSQINETMEKVDEVIKEVNEKISRKESEEQEEEQQKFPDLSNIGNW